MDGNPNQSWDADDLRIDLKTPYVVAYWANQLGITPDDLRLTVSRCGPVMRNVKRELDCASKVRGRLVWEQTGTERRGNSLLAAGI